MAVTDPQEPDPRLILAAIGAYSAAMRARPRDDDQAAAAKTELERLQAARDA